MVHFNIILLVAVLSFGINSGQDDDVTSTCSDASGDPSIVFAIDQSSSVITEQQFEQEKYYAVQAIRDLSEVSGSVRIAVIAYADKATVTHGFSDSQDPNDVIAAIKGLSWSYNVVKLTDTTGALTVAQKLLGGEEADYTAVVIFSDGYDTVGDDSFTSVSATVTGAGHAIYAVGVDPYSSAHLVELTGGDASYLFDLDDDPSALTESLCIELSGGGGGIIGGQVFGTCVFTCCGNVDLFQPTWGVTMYPDMPNPQVDDEPEFGIQGSSDVTETTDISADFKTLTLRQWVGDGYGGAGWNDHIITISSLPIDVTSFQLLTSSYVFPSGDTGSEFTSSTAWYGGTSTAAPSPYGDTITTDYNASAIIIYVPAVQDSVYPTVYEAKFLINAPPIP